MSITDWPEGERPREKLIANGANSLSDAELLAIFLRTGVKGKSAVDLARELLTDFDGLRSLLNADKKQFCSAHGLGSAKYAQLQAVLEMSKRHLDEDLKRGSPLTSPDITKKFLTSKMRDYQHEVFAVLFLDSKNRVIRFEELFFGTINSAAIYPREVAKRVLTNNAAAVIFAHNHPSGVAEPSKEDRRITTRLKDALELIGVTTLDHLVVGDNEIVSFSERGWL